MNVARGINTAWRSRWLKAMMISGLAMTVVACDSIPVEPQSTYGRTKSGERQTASSYEEFEANRKTVFGDGGLFSGAEKSAPGTAEGGGLGVNSFLWRASLDTISFMPVTSADPFGGVIITDWHALNQAPNERFKLNVYILGRALRADGVRVAAFRQIQDQTGIWRDAELPGQTSTSIEDAILTRARQLRNETVLR